jgi:phage tail protein X
MADETIETVTVQTDGMTASLIVWRRFRRAMPGVVERLYELNPGLADAGVILPIGAVIKLPIPAGGTNPADVTPVRLWS